MGAGVGHLAYRSPTRWRWLGSVEERFLASDHSVFTGKELIYVRTVADVPLVLYLNFLADRQFAHSLAPGLFHPMEIEGQPSRTLFTILVFCLRNARPRGWPRLLGTVSPQIMQANWRFYGQIAEVEHQPQPGVLFWRTVTDSLTLAVFGRRLARCFPLQRARSVRLQRETDRVPAEIDPGQGSAPFLRFAGTLESAPQVPHIFQGRFVSYVDYACWVMDQHLSLTLRPGESVLQDMSLVFERAHLVPLRSTEFQVSQVESFLGPAPTPVDCFAAVNLEVFLESIRVACSTNVHPGGIRPLSERAR